MTSNTSYLNPTPRPKPRLEECGPRTLLDLEVYNQKNRILSTLNKTLHKIEVAISLPFLLTNNCELLQPLLTGKELALIARCMSSGFQNNQGEVKKENKAQSRPIDKLGTQLVKQRDNLMEGFGSFYVLSQKLVTLSVDVARSNPRPRPTGTRGTERRDPSVCRVIHMLCSKQRTCLRKLIQDKGAEISPGGSNFLRNFHLLRNLIDDRLSTTHSALNSRSRELRFAWRRNEKAKLHIAHLTSKLQSQKNLNATLLESLQQRIKKEHVEVTRLVYNCRCDRQNIVETSEAHMVAECRRHEPKLNELVQATKGCNLKVAALLKENLQIEKNLRAKRLRVEGKLIAWLEKYDQDIQEKQAEWDDIQAGFEAETKSMEILQEEFNIQEKEYNKLMAEKEAEYQLELEEKMFIFICNRAARRIQKYWRAYHERKLARKKRHKGKKGKGSGKKK